MLGAHNVREEFEEGRLELVSENWFAHPKWSQIGIRNDIGLIQLPYKINFTDIISPICLPSYSDVSDDFAGLDVSKIIYKQMLNVCPLMVVKNRFQFHEKTLSYISFIRLQLPDGENLLIPQTPFLLF